MSGRNKYTSALDVSDMLVKDDREDNGAFGKRILKNKYDSDFTFFKNKSYFIQLFQKQIIFY
jgi:hypothetical protein